MIHRINLIYLQKKMLYTTQEFKGLSYNEKKQYLIDLLKDTDNIYEEEKDTMIKIWNLMWIYEPTTELLDWLYPTVFEVYKKKAEKDKVKKINSKITKMIDTHEKTQKEDMEKAEQELLSELTNI